MKLVRRFTSTIAAAGKSHVLVDYPTQKDHTIKVFSVKKNFRASFVDNTTSLQTAVEKFQLSDEKQVTLLGKCFSTSLLISSLLKNEERIKVEVSFANSLGQINDFYAESMANGEIRGFALNRNHQAEPFNPFLKISKILYGERQQQFSAIPLEMDLKADWVDYSGTTVTDFYTKSEQLLNICDLNTQVASKTSTDTEKLTENSNEIITVNRSFGYMIQKMPGAKENYLEALHNDILSSPLYSHMKDERLNVSLVKELLKDIDDLEVSRCPVDFFCRCSKEQYMKMLLNIGLETIEDMHLKEQRVLKCVYCNTDHVLSDKDFEQLKSESKQKSSQTIKI